MVKKKTKFKRFDVNNPQTYNVKNPNNSLNTSSDLSLGSESSSSKANDSICADDILSDSPNKDKSLTTAGSEDLAISGEDDHNRMTMNKSDIAGFKKLSVGVDDEVSSKTSRQEKKTFNSNIKKTNREPGAGGHRKYGNSAGGISNVKNISKDEKLQWGNYHKEKDFSTVKNEYYSSNKSDGKRRSQYPVDQVIEQSESQPQYLHQPTQEKNRSLDSISEPLDESSVGLYNTSNETTDTSRSAMDLYNRTQDTINSSNNLSCESWDNSDSYIKDLEASAVSGGIGKNADQSWSRVVQNKTTENDHQNAYLPKSQRSDDRAYNNQHIEQRRDRGRGRMPSGPSKKFEQTDVPFASEKSIKEKSQKPNDDVMYEDRQRRGFSMGSEKNDYNQNWRNKDDTDNRNNYPKKYSEGNENTGFKKSYGDSKITRQNREFFDRDSENVDTEYKQFQGERRRNREEVVFKRVNEIQQDLFAMAKEYSLAHCVAEDMRMGSGIAVNFKRDFKDIDILFSQKQKQGGLAVLQQDERYIYYLVTKRVSNGKPTYETLWSSLKKMRDHIEENHVEKLAIPRLGCGLDRLEWGTVKHMLEFLFRDVDIEITVCNFQQTEDSPEKPYNSTCKLVNVKKSIVDIEEETSIIYLSTEDGNVSTEMEELNKKYPFLGEFNRAPKNIGVVVKHQVPKKLYVINGCIVRKTKNDPFDFIGFRKCVQQINKDCRKEKYYYVAFQAISDDEDDLLNEKIITILKNYLNNVELYICWDGDLVYKMPLTTRD